MTIISVKTHCPICHKDDSVDVIKEEYEDYQSGKLIQKAMPSLSDDQREQLLTGICGKCWDELFKDIDEDE